MAKAVQRRASWLVQAGLLTGVLMGAAAVAVLDLPRPAQTAAAIISPAEASGR